MSAPLRPEDQELIERATRAIADREVPGWHGVGAALRTPSGKIYEAVHLEADVGRIAVCAETIAIGKAVYDSEFGISAIVAVLASGEGHYAVVPPCGMCRELISDYGPGARVLHPDGTGAIVATPIEDLLPAKWREATVHPKVPRPKPSP
jgi:cytidine deaminase